MMCTVERALKTLALGCIVAVAGCGGGAAGDSGNDVYVTDAAADTAFDDTAMVPPDAPASDTPAIDAPAMDTATPDVARADTTSMDTPASDASPGMCPAATLGARLGRRNVLVGGSMDDAPFRMAPFDIRYRYISGDVPNTGTCSSCMTGCSIRGTTCANSGPGCSWWGCWQWDMQPPGRYAADFVNATRMARAIPMFSYYVWYSVAGDVEGATEIARLNDGPRVQRYLADWRFLCRTIAAAGAGPVILHVEPDLWGYAHQVNANPAMIPAAVSAAGLSECAGLPDTVAGFARCMLRVARANAPMALVGFHASAWGAGDDALYTRVAGFDPVMHADRTAAFMRAIGATEADLIVIEMNDRDSGFNMRWFDETNRTVPNFTRALAWAQRLSQQTNMATLYWQIPYGHRGLENRCNRYEDNRVAYFFDHPDEFARAGALGIAFGAGAGCQTTPNTDDGFFIGRAMRYFGAARPCLCGGTCM